jgi:hypothetical protein
MTDRAGGVFPDMGSQTTEASENRISVVPYAQVGDVGSSSGDGVQKEGALGYGLVAG